MTPPNRRPTEVFLNNPQEPDMSATEAHEASGNAIARKSDMKLEIEVIAVSDVDRAKKFYEQLGWRLDDDASPLEGLRIVQFTPPGSGTSITFGEGLIAATPGAAETGLTVSDIEAAHDEVRGYGIEASDIWHGPPFPVEARQPGRDPERTSYGSFFSFDDPDGNTWLVQEVTTRHPGRMSGTDTGYVSAADLEAALRRAEAAHHEHETRSGGQDQNWPAWYASYMVAEQAGTDLPS
jgi:catechol 2,3-dioxygenase-like lactoylglutathione lyase family enzyme